MKIAIVGATGFVGAALTEALIKDPSKEVVPLIRSAGNAWSLARHGIDLKTVDLLDRSSIKIALENCTHVVNCSRGDNKVMLDGLKNLIKECKRQDVRKFIHLSSVAVYGDPPPADSVDEAAATRPDKGGYGWIKLKQDDLVQSAARSGLPSVILCPPNILGPGSYFLLQVLNSVSAGKFLLADDGNAPCCTVDVANLVHAIVLALESNAVNGDRLFITDDEDTTWGQIVRKLVPLSVGNPDLRNVSLDELLARRVIPKKTRLSVIQTFKHLFSGEVRSALRQDPLLSVVDTGLRSAVAGLGSSIEGTLRKFISGSIHVPLRAEFSPEPDLGLSSQQLRGVMHSCARAKNRIKYSPAVSCDASLTAFSAWYTQSHGFDSQFADLYKHLY